MFSEWDCEMKFTPEPMALKVDAQIVDESTSNKNIAARVLGRCSFLIICVTTWNKYVHCVSKSKNSFGQFVPLCLHQITNYFKMVMTPFTKYFHLDAIYTGHQYKCEKHTMHSIYIHEISNIGDKPQIALF